MDEQTQREAMFKHSISKQILQKMARYEKHLTAAKEQGGEHGTMAFVLGEVVGKLDGVSVQLKATNARVDGMSAQLSEAVDGMRLTAAECRRAQDAKMAEDHAALEVVTSRVAGLRAIVLLGVSVVLGVIKFLHKG